MNKIFEQEKKWLLEEKYNGEKCEAFFADIQKLERGFPVAYLIGNQPFLNCVIDLEYKPLIPRNETEFWVNDFIKEQKKLNFAKQNSASKIRILDLFSGSGCIGIALLKNIKNIKVNFGEIKAENIKQIRKNIKINKLQNRNYQIFHSDIFKNIPKQKYDFILSNPPYISYHKKKMVQNSVIENEDKLALFAIDDGLFFIKKIIIEGKRYLNKDGEIWIEFDSWQKKLIESFLKEQKITKFKFWKDQYQKYRVLILQYS